MKQIGFKKVEKFKFLYALFLSLNGFCAPEFCGVMILLDFVGIDFNFGYLLCLRLRLTS